MQKTQPTTTTDLKSKAILVDFDGAFFNWTRRDPRVEKAVAESNAISSGAGRYLKNLFLSADSTLASIRACVQAARSDHHLMTIPWEKQRSLLLNENFMRYTKAQSNHVAQLDQLKSQLSEEYPSLISSAQAALGALFRTEDYPEISEVLSACSIQHKFFPLSDSSDVRLEVGDETLASIRAEVEKNQQAQLSSALNHAWARFSAILESATSNLAKSAETGGRFRTEWHSHLAEFLPLLSGLNLSKDPRLDELASRAEKLLDLPVEDYAISPEVRSKGFSAAQKIYDDLKAIYSTGA